MAACANADVAQNPVNYTCDAGGSLAVRRNAAFASVSVGGKAYDLQRKRSSVGEKYLSADAALIIDGTSAIFVADRNLDLGTCTEAVPLALGSGSKRAAP